jgi:hypothetical protein
VNFSITLTKVSNAGFGSMTPSKRRAEQRGRCADFHSTLGLSVLFR